MGDEKRISPDPTKYHETDSRTCENRDHTPYGREQPFTRGESKYINISHSLQLLTPTERLLTISISTRRRNGQQPGPIYPGTI